MKTAVYKNFATDRNHVEFIDGSYMSNSDVAITLTGGCWGYQVTIILTGSEIEYVNFDDERKAKRYFCKREAELSEFNRIVALKSAEAKRLIG